MNPFNKPPPRSNYTRVGKEDHYDEDGDEENSIRNGIQSHKQIIREQDQNLDGLHSAVQRLGTLSFQISTELDSQNLMLDELNDETEKTTEILDHITKKTKELIKQSGGMKYFCIIIWLLVVLIILTYLVIMS